MDFAEYQERAYSTCTPSCYTDIYLDLGYLSEVGELAGKLAKRVRGDVVPDEDIIGEVGDVAWMIAIKARLHKRKININDIDIDFEFAKLPEFMNKLAELESNDVRMAAIVVLSERLGLDFSSCLLANNEKLASRKARGKINGNGDDR